MALTKVTGEFIDISDLDLSDVGTISLDAIQGDADANTSITFSGSDVITIATGGSGRLTIGDGALSPVTDNQIDLGTASLEFKDAFFDGTVTADAFAGPLTGNVTGNASGTALTVTQAAQSAITSVGTLTALTGGTGDLIWDTNTLVVDSSANKVGIGTTTPTYLLDVESTSAWGAIFELNQKSDGTEGAQLFLKHESASAADNDYIGFLHFKGMNDAGTPEEVQYARIYATTADVTDGNEDGSLFFDTAVAGTANSSVMALVGGNVGIGIAAPTYALDIDPGSASAFRILNATNGQDLNCAITNDGTTTGDDTLLSLSSHASGGDPSLRLSISGNESYSIGLDNSDADKLKISNSSTVGTSTAMTIYGTKVGIGTASPSYPLDVSFSGHSGIRAISTSGDSRLYLTSDGSANASSIFFGDDASATIGGLVYDHSANALKINTNDAERMRIDSSGNVGIGAIPEATETGWTNVSIGGLGTIINSTSANAGGRTQLANNVYTDTDGNYSYISTDEATLYKQINGIHSWHYAASGSADAHISMSEAMRIAADGKVGIGGITAPATPLDVLAGSTGSNPYVATAITMAPSNFPARTWQLRIDDGGAAGYGFSIAAADNRILYLNNNNRVGINEVSPDATFHVTGADGIRNERAGAGVYDMSIDNTVTGDAADLNFIAQTNDTGYHFRVRKADANLFSALTMNSDGKIGIGTTSPDDQLHVAGGLRVNTTTGDGDEARLYMNPGGAADDPQFTLYRHDGVSTSVYLRPGNYNYFENRIEIATTQGAGLSGSKLAIKANADTYQATAHNEDAAIRIDVANAEGNYAGIGFTHSGQTEGFFGFTRPNATGDIADFVWQGYDGNSNSYKEYFRIAANGDLTAIDTSIASNSDERLKKNIKDFTGGLDLIAKLKPRTFEWKEPQQRKEGTRRGFIAQEVLEVDDYWVDELEAQDKENPEYEYTKDTEKAYTSKLSDKDAMYISAIQELEARIAALEE